MLWAIGVLCVGLASAKSTGLDLEVSLENVEGITLTKEQQKAEWLDLKDEKYNAKGFYQWKSQKEGFILLNKDSAMLSCHVKTNEQHESMTALKVGFDCKEMASKVTDKVAVSAGAAESRFKAKFTPMQSGHVLHPLDPELEFEHEQDAAGSMASHGTWGREVNIDDSVYEGEANNANQDIEEASEKDEHEETRFLDKIDIGPGDLFHDEEAEEQSHKHHYGRINRKSKRTHEEIHFPQMIDTPYVDAGVDREVNDKMYEFFKKHPQYHTPEAHWRAARKWKKILNRSEGAGSSGDPDATSHGGLWGANSCSSQQKVPLGWPDVPTMKCKHYAVSPMGYWGCQWLFEDGTCGFIQFYPTIRWDGLDSYVTRNHDPEDKDLMINGALPGSAKMSA